MGLVADDPSPGPQGLLSAANALASLLQEKLAAEIVPLNDLLGEPARHAGLLLRVLVHLIN